MEFPAVSVRGDSGPHVAYLQQALQGFGYAVDADGRFGPGTEAAVKDFQAKNGLKPDGWVGKNTQRVLFQQSQSLLPRDPTVVLPNPTTTGLSTDAKLRSAGVRADISAAWSVHLDGAMNWASIRSPNNTSAFLANVLHESCFLTTFVENLNYSAAALLKQWPRRFSVADANQYGRKVGQPANQKMIAILAYGNRNGNRPYPSTDGWDYRGQGPIQLTFQSNYAAFSRDTGIDIVSNPSAILDPYVGSLAAAWFWRTRGCDALAESESLTALCERINGGQNGLAERNRLFYHLRQRA